MAEEKRDETHENAEETYQNSDHKVGMPQGEANGVSDLGWHQDRIGTNGTIIYMRDRAYHCLPQPAPSRMGSYTPVTPIRLICACIDCSNVIA